MVDENRMYQGQLQQHTRRKLGDHAPAHDHCVVYRNPDQRGLHARLQRGS
jgi:hypothetical protein